MKRTTAITIDTEHGTAMLWWDDESDPSTPGWVLRYHLEPPDSDHALGRRHLDVPLDAELGDVAGAEREARRFLAQEGVGVSEPTKRRPGRPVTTGTPPVRTTRQGEIWLQADTVAKQRGETVHQVITRALERYVRRHGANLRKETT